LSSCAFHTDRVKKKKTYRATHLSTSRPRSSSRTCSRCSRRRRTSSVWEACVPGSHECKLDAWCETKPNTADEHGYTKLMKAVQRNDLRSVSMLLDKNVDVNAVGKDGLTGLLFRDPARTALLRHYS